MRLPPKRQSQTEGLLCYSESRAKEILFRSDHRFGFVIFEP